MILIGENIHVISKEINGAIEKRNPEPIQKLARLQAEAGANYLDLNLGPLTKNPIETVQWVIHTVQEAVDLPLSIDTINPIAMVAALEVCNKTPLINSASGTSESMEKILPLTQKYSAEVIILALNDEGLPNDADDRADVLMDILEGANSLGIPNERIWIDGLLMPACVNQDQVVQYLDFVQMVPDLAPGAKTVTGLSNISSCGTPKEFRGILNRTFMVMVSQHGQSAVIADVLDEELLRLNRGELPQISQLVSLAMDGEEINLDALSDEERAYVKTVDVLMGRTIYSHSWLE